MLMLIFIIVIVAVIIGNWICYNYKKVLGLAKKILKNPIVCCVVSNEICILINLLIKHIL